MDYRTNPMTRKQARELSVILRKLFSIPPTGRLPVLEALEAFADVFPGSYYEILDDDEMPIIIPARCQVMKDGTFIISIRKTIYDGAYSKEIGAFRDHIFHEICHAFLYTIGFTPIMERNLNNKKKINYRYESSEWQAKAVCGEAMMPYDETKDMSEAEIVSIYGVSPAQARYRKKY